MRDQRSLDIQKAQLELETLLLEGLEGPVAEMTREGWESICREALAGLAAEQFRRNESSSVHHPEENFDDFED